VSGIAPFFRCSRKEGWTGASIFTQISPSSPKSQQEDSHTNRSWQLLAAFSKQPAVDLSPSGGVQSYHGFWEVQPPSKPLAITNCAPESAPNSAA